GGVPVELPQERRSLFGLRPVRDHRTTRAEEVEEPRRLTAVHLGEVAAGRLQRGCELGAAHVPRLGLGLHEPLDAVTGLAHHEAEPTELGLVDHHYGPWHVRRLRGPARNADDREEPTRLVDQAAVAQLPP